MKTIYVHSKKIISRDVLDFFVVIESLELMSKLRNFLLSSEQIDCTDVKGFSNLINNNAFNHFLIFGKDMKKFFGQLNWFCNKENIFLFNGADKEGLLQKERVFSTKNKKVKEYLSSLKDDYDIHKANNDVVGMANCIKTAEEIASGSIKAY